MKQTFVNLFSKKGIFCLFFCMSIGQLSAQGGYLPTVKTPASPVAASFNVYGEIPVSKYTGIPDISIPLYTIDLGGLQIPISLSYHPAGVRVEAEASWVGLGWTLTAGGTISREIKGLDDFKIGGHWWRFNEPGITEDYKKPIPWDRINCDIWLTNELCPCYFNMDTRFDVLPCGRDHLRVSKRTLRIDCEPDLFSYNFLGYSGRFVIKEGENTAILEKPEDGLDIKIFKVGNLYYIDVTLPTGDICHFYQFEESTPYSGESIESSNSVGQTSITSWCLSSIEFLNGDFISYEYISKNNVERNTYLTYIWQSDRIGDASASPLLNRDISNAEVPNQECGGLSILPEYTSYSKSWFSNGSLANTELYLKKISWNGNIINFTHSLRSDYGRNYFSQNQPVCMSGLEVRNQKNKLVKGYSFNYSYFDIEGSNKASYLKKRLRLDSFYEYSSAGNLPSYRFTYDTRYELPLKNSLSFDVWGYYNGTYASSPGTDLLPEIVSSGNTRYFNWEYPGRTGTLINNGRNMRCSPLIQQRSNNLVGGYDAYYTSYNFAGEPNEVLHTHSSSYVSSLTERYSYTYDHGGRLRETTHSLNGGAARIMALNDYDELGRLSKKILPDNSDIITYGYNIRNWLNQIQSTYYRQTNNYGYWVRKPESYYNGNPSCISYSTTYKDPVTQQLKQTDEIYMKCSYGHDYLSSVSSVDISGKHYTFNQKLQEFGGSAPEGGGIIRRYKGQEEDYLLLSSWNYGFDYIYEGGGMMYLLYLFSLPRNILILLQLFSMMLMVISIRI